MNGFAGLEALLFSASVSLPTSRIAFALDCTDEAALKLLAEYAASLEAEGRGFRLRKVAGGWRLHSDPALAGTVRRGLEEEVEPRLSPAAMETLAVIAYLQPVTRSRVSAIRGVNVESVLSKLLQRELVAEAGRADSPGQPILYRTTPEFLRAFGLVSLADLPPLDSFATTPEEAESIRVRLGLRPDGAIGDEAGPEEAPSEEEDEAPGEETGEASEAAPTAQQE